MKRARIVLHRLGILAALASTMPALANVTVTTPLNNIAVELGSYVDVPFVFSNDGNQAATANLALGLAWPGYTFEQRSQPECGDFVGIYPPSVGRKSFSVAAIASHSQRTCVLRLTRAVPSIDDPYTIDNGYAAWYLGTNDIQPINLAMGTFVDISIAATPVSSDIDANGILHEVFRLQAHNDGAIDANNIVLGLGQVCSPPAVSVETNLPGGCVSTFAGHYCPEPGGFGVKLPMVAAGGTQSCLVRVSAPLSAHASVPSYLPADTMTNAATGGLIGDLDDTNNRPSLQLAAQPSGSEAVGAPTLSPGFLALLAIIIASAAAWTVRIRNAARV